MSHRPPVAAALLLAAGALPVRAAEVGQVMELAKPAIVRIEVLMAEGQDGRMVKQRGYGSGAIITPDGYVLTNHHVAGRGTRFRCTLADRQESTVRLTVTRKLKGKDQMFEITAVSFDGKDLLVASLSEIESGGEGLLGNLMMMGEDGDEEEAADSPLGGKVADKGELTRIAMLRADATEADLVLTDAALDLAFVRVRPAAGTVPAMPAAPPPAKTAPALLENVLSTQRKGPDFQRAASAELLQIAALVTTPRAFYIPSQMLPGGTAVYNLAGKMLGIATSVHNESVIVPVAAIAKLAATIPAKQEQPEK